MKLFVISIVCFVSLSSSLKGPCSQAHCDLELSGYAGHHYPKSIVYVWKAANGGTLTGLGCSSSGETAVCAVSDTNASLVMLDGLGQRLWANDFARPDSDLGAPLFTPANSPTGPGIALCDGQYIMKVTLNGAPNYRTHIIDTGGVCFSPTMTSDGFLLVVQQYGPVSGFDDWDQGECKASVWLNFTLNGTIGFYAPTGTPAVWDARFYVLTQFTSTAGNQTSVRRLYAFDARRVMSGRIATAWWFDYVGTHDATPLLLHAGIVYFTSNTGGITWLWAVQDTGVTPHLVWNTRPFPRSNRRAASDPEIASLAIDTDKSLWVSFVGSPVLVQIHAPSGKPMQAVDVSELFNNASDLAISSQLTTVGTGKSSAVLFAVASPQLNAVLALGTHSLAPLWTQHLGSDPSSSVFGQLVVVKRTDINGSHTVVFGTRNDGVYGLSDQCPQLEGC